jgi:hypothetical protein
MHLCVQARLKGVDFVDHKGGVSERGQIGVIDMSLRSHHPHVVF